jgi:opacity protein-like surface antigen
MKYMLTIVLLIAASSIGLSQSLPKAEIFGGYSYLRTDSEDVGFVGFDALGIPPTSGRRNSANLNGYNFAITGRFNDRIGIVGDFAGHFGNANLDVSQLGLTVRTRIKTQQFTFLAGPQIYLSKGKTRPFVRAMAGYARLNQSIDDLGISDGVNSFAAAFGGGLDANLTENLSARIFQADFLLVRVDGGGIASDNRKSLRISTGLVIR